MTLSVRDVFFLTQIDRSGDGAIEADELINFVDGSVENNSKRDGKIDAGEQAGFEGLLTGVLADQTVAKRLVEMLEQIKGGGTQHQPYYFSDSIPAVLKTAPGRLAFIPSSVDLGSLKLKESRPTGTGGEYPNSHDIVTYTFTDKKGNQLTFEARYRSSSHDLYHGDLLLTITSRRKEVLVRGHRIETPAEASFWAKIFAKAATEEKEFSVGPDSDGKKYLPYLTQLLRNAQGDFQAPRPIKEECWAKMTFGGGSHPMDGDWFTREFDPSPFHLQECPLGAGLRFVTRPGDASRISAISVFIKQPGESDYERYKREQTPGLETSLNEEDRQALLRNLPIISQRSAGDLPRAIWSMVLLHVSAIADGHHKPLATP